MADVQKIKQSDGTDHIIVRPDPAILAISALRGSRQKRKFKVHGSLVKLVLELRAAGVERITFNKRAYQQVQRELKELGRWDELKDTLLEDTNG